MTALFPRTSAVSSKFVALVAEINEMKRHKEEIEIWLNGISLRNLATYWIFVKMDGVALRLRF